MDCWWVVLVVAGACVWLCSFSLQLFPRLLHGEATEARQRHWQETQDAIKNSYKQPRQPSAGTQWQIKHNLVAMPESTAQSHQNLNHRTPNAKATLLPRRMHPTRTPHAPTHSS